MNAGTRGDRRKAIVQRLKDEEDEEERLEALAEMERVTFIDRKAVPE